MSRLFSRSTRGVIKPLAMAVAVVAPIPVIAQTNQDHVLAPVVVSASRFPDASPQAPIGATVITAEDIRRSGVNNVNQAIRKIGGVYGRQSTFGSQDFDLDLRGFGTNSAQNLVVMVDGIRLSENEGLVATLSSIPIETVERIEIIRGGSGVLYGDGATGGVIQIVTKQPQKQGLHGSVTGELGQFDHREVRTSIFQRWNELALDAHISTQRADNYRHNNAIEQQSFSGGLQWITDKGRAGLRVETAEQNSRLAGGLTLAQFEENPRQTLTPNRYAETDSERYTAFWEQAFGAWEVAGELSRRERTTLYGTDGQRPSIYKGEQTQFSPRVRHLGGHGALANELVMGLDFIDWTRDSTSRSGVQERATQESLAAYVRDELKFDRARLAAGVRREWFDKDSINLAPGSVPDYRKKYALNAWELQGAYDLAPSINLFAKVGRSYRVPNVDENGFTADGSPLKEQTSRDLEIGTGIGDAARRVTVKLFQHQLENEIYYDPTIGSFGANTNLDPTRRRGFEVDASIRIAHEFKFFANWQHVKARFTEGVNAGREMVMVPENTVSMRLSWEPDDGQTVDAGLQWVDSQRYGGDFENSCASRIPSFTTVDARYAKRLGAWELAIAGNNLTDKDYFSQAYRCRASIYPSSGRQVFLSARYEF